MARENEFHMPTFAEQQALMRRAEVLRARAIADMFRAVRSAITRYFAAQSAVAH
ncbi:hypothetical protein DEA8626_01596 [Defluviimonas aquaemixtae]|uniref:Uncharacterized protein n=1 Tax=Albidovulum aquaemixtae TaxID=1542388 RepID=A0A2R8B689_9RHOB|nr:hypothetical protein [Defluviimonas aquaemixtae]SPH18066.1 hypothetical protein DEA8626_01596 [Defluviimonas aquaemixtae]